MQLSADNVALVRFDLRLRLWEKVFVSLNSNVGMYGDAVSPFSNGNFMVGEGFSIAYNSVVGPIELNLSTSNLNQKIIPYFSLGYSF